MKLEKIKLSKLKSNTGQIEGLPANPRLIKDSKYQKLVKSLQDDPEMLELREIVAYDNNGELIVIMGNMRYKALTELGIKETFVKVLPNNTPVEKLKAYTIKDNVSFGENDFDMLANEWDDIELEDWGVDLPMIEEIEEDVPSKTDLIEKRQIYSKANFDYISLFKKSKEGIELKKIKEPEYFERIAYLFYLHISKIIKNKNTCLVCPPARRHKDWNLAIELTKYVAEKIGCNYDINLFKTDSLRKFNPEIDLNNTLMYDNYVIIDDILTTGQTVEKCVELLGDRNILVFIAINNN